MERPRSLMGKSPPIRKSPRHKCSSQNIKETGHRAGFFSYAFYRGRIILTSDSRYLLLSWGTSRKPTF